MAGKLYVMRHFETYDNKNCIFMGQLNVPTICPPIESGKYNKYKNSIILCSPLLRAEQTAKYILSCSPNANIKLHFIENLKERSLGEFEGRKKSEVNGDSRYFYNKKLILENTPPGGENIHDFIKRIESTIPIIENYLKDNDIIVITHLQVLRVMCCYYSKYDLTQWYSIKYPYGEIVDFFKFTEDLVI